MKTKPAHPGLQLLKNDLLNAKNASERLKGAFRVVNESGYLVILLRPGFVSDSIKTTRDSALNVLRNLGYSASVRLRENACGGYCPRDIAVSILEAMGYEVTLREGDPGVTPSPSRRHLKPVE